MNDIASLLSLSPPVRHADNARISVDPCVPVEPGLACAPAAAERGRKSSGALPPLGRERQERPLGRTATIAVGVERIVDGPFVSFFFFSLVYSACSSTISVHERVSTGLGLLLIDSTRKTTSSVCFKKNTVSFFFSLFFQFLSSIFFFFVLQTIFHRRRHRRRRIEIERISSFRSRFSVFDFDALLQATTASSAR